MPNPSFEADYPGAIVYPADSRNYYAPPNTPRGLVIHTPEEPADNYPGTPIYFSRWHPERGPASTHYFASYLGFIYQCVPESHAAVANGVRNRPYPAWANSSVSLNRQTISIEVEGYAATIGATLSPNQRSALVKWIGWLCLKYVIPIDREHIIGHYEVADNRSDPGTLPLDAIVAEAAELGIPESEFDMPIELRRPDGARYLLAPDGRKYHVRDQGHRNALIKAGLIADGEHVELTDGEINDIPSGTEYYPA